MKKLILVLAVLLTLPAVAQANVELGVNMPGLSLHIGDRDDRGYYWDGGDWRPPGWWDQHYRDEGRGHWVYYEPAPPPPRYWHHEHWHEGPPPGYWRDGPPGHWRDGPPGHWREGPPPGRW
ncbi:MULTISPECIES: DUF2502 domain-containing protein [Rahnella]|uniref:DUF2502 domain-containing protein n=1 Tax=Rahnella sp. (strain Y9602) TaxID=2703885 RepID=A0A0H3FI35_RAHSY|nr:MULTISPECIES: DUF2502 domain-containing protein [Rahnella]AYA07814.1 DUF2502 domain-containing protein [Rahnella aquatilis]ADW74588.1 Protein of unknown function DUF2502 [Rahnella aceris]AZP43041.1 DUF2502 domain-containing protein [Rahnella aquatilis]AZP47380.1 DUF2502 domain-containing protein [Rahnella aquatilis]AZP51824.1 DUF2502 domain-containing protein [Rahnella aquatilis]